MSLQIQKFQSILSNLLTTSQKFTDQEFFPDPPTTIGGPYSKYTYMRASEIMDSPNVFFKEIEPCDIKQGLLKDSYYLSALACLAENPDLIERLFLTEEANSAGLYAIWLCEDGTWRPILLDDFIPVRPYHGNYFPVFSQCNNGELWVSLLEKAYAKVHGCYTNIENGLCHNALRDLTGAPVDELYDEQDVEKVWHFIKEGVDNKFFLTCGTEVPDEEDDEHNEGIVRGHAYSILDAREVHSSRGVERLVKIRNPWGNFEWKGDWSDKSPLWTEDLRKQFNYHIDPEDGIFFMTIHDYNKYFPVTWVCKYKRNNYYSSVNFSHTTANFNVVRLTVNKTSEITISLNQKDKRFFKGTNYANYLYSYSRILIGKVEKDGLHYCGGNASGFDRNLQITEVLSPGTYLITAEVNWNQDYYKTYNLSFYSESEIYFEGVPNVDLLGIQKNIIKSAITQIENNKTVTNYGKYGDAAIQKTVDCIHGIFYFYYENNSKKKSKLCETIKFSQISNLKISPPFNTDNQFEVTVLPGNELLVVYKATLDDYSWGYSASFFLQTTTRDDEKTPINSYKYMDDPIMKIPLEVNNDYNLFVKNNSTDIREKLRQKQQDHTAQEEEKHDYSEAYFEHDGADRDQQYYYYNPEAQRRGKSTGSASLKNTANTQMSLQQKIKSVTKPPKIYPDVHMQVGQTNAKKVQYTNHDDYEKDILVVSTDPKSLFIKSPNLVVRPGETVDIRMRFQAPGRPGTYVNKIEVRVNGENYAEETLQFTIINHQ